jgi:DNA primase
VNQRSLSSLRSSAGYRRFDFRLLKSIPIATVARDLGFVLGRSGSGQCKLPNHDDRNPSFSAHKGSNTFRCFGCGGHGSTIDLVIAMTGGDFFGACRWLDQTYFGAGHELFRPKLIPRAPARERWRETRTQSDPEVYRWLLQQSPLQLSGIAYLRSRGISQATWESFQVGQIGNGFALLQKAGRQWSIERLKRCGLVVEGPLGQRLAFRSTWLLFPFFVGTEITYLQSRSLTKEGQMRWMSLSGILPPIYNANAASDSTTSVTICEGVTDVLSAAELGFSAIGVLGAHAHFDDGVVGQLGNKDIFLAGDADKAGQAFNKRIAKLLSIRGLTVIRKQFPAGIKDLNEYLTQKRRGTS